MVLTFAGELGRLSLAPFERVFERLPLNGDRKPCRSQTTVGKPSTRGTQSLYAHHTSLEEWRKRLSDPASNIIYLALQPNDQFPVSSRNPSAAGLLFAHPRSHPEPLKNGCTQSLHIWLAGVSEEYRGRRCLDIMVNALIELERKQRGPEPSTMLVLTVCTTPLRFPSMWSWLKARKQWVLEREWVWGKVMLSMTEWNTTQWRSCCVGAE